MSGAGEACLQLGELTVEFAGDEAIIHGPSTGGEEREVECEPTALVAWTRFDDLGRYRPLRGARTMRHDWRTRCSKERLEEALDAVYPLALHHITDWTNGNLRLVGLDEVLSRQSGRYELSSKLAQEARDAAAEVLCARCVKVPVWRGERPERDDIPCPEPCSVLVSLCREAAIWEEGLPEPVEPESSVQFADFETAGNEIREAYLRVRLAATSDKGGS